MYVKLHYPDTKVKFLSICEKVMDSKPVPEYVLNTFHDRSYFGNHLLYRTDKMSQNSPESNL
jgi:hypothetical protein